MSSMEEQRFATMSGKSKKAFADPINCLQLLGLIGQDHTRIERFTNGSQNHMRKLVSNIERIKFSEG